eukprot:gene7456-11781_t
MQNSKTFKDIPEDVVKHIILPFRREIIKYDAMLYIKWLYQNQQYQNYCTNDEFIDCLWFIDSDSHGERPKYLIIMGKTLIVPIDELKKSKYFADVLEVKGMECKDFENCLTYMQCFYMIFENMQNNMLLDGNPVSPFIEDYLEIIDKEDYCIHSIDGMVKKCLDKMPLECYETYEKCTEDKFQKLKLAYESLYKEYLEIYPDHKDWCHEFNSFERRKIRKYEI